MALRMFSLPISLLALLAPLVFADEPVYSKDAEYDSTAYGLFPMQTYKSTTVISPRINVLQHSSECDDSLYTMLTPRGGVVRAVYEPSATILDSKGHLVWTLGGREEVYNLMVQEYLGDQYLTFWAGNDAVGGHGAGHYYMLDTSYNEVFKLGAANKLQADLHDFRITSTGTAMITVYEIINRDLTELGNPFEGPIWDCLIQEIDIRTKELVFEWRASEHFRLEDTIREIGDDGVLGRAFDWFHINSVDKDLKGNYLVSSRFLHMIAYIDTKTGEVLWVLGGKRNSFKDLSGGKATNLAYQHDARWSDDYTTITVFNNGVDDAHRDITDTRGMRIKIDQESMTAKLVAEYLNPNHLKAVSQGSFQTLGNGNSFMGYGNTAAFTEYSGNGTVLCDTHFGPQARFGAGEVQSYRVYKYEWHGWPTTNPDVTILKSGEMEWSLFVSWNGATEVEVWTLAGTDDSENGEWQEIAKMEKDGFENEFKIPSSTPRYVRVNGVNRRGEVLGTSNPLNISIEKVWSQPPLHITEGGTWYLKLLIGFCGVAAISVLLREALMFWRSRRKRVHFEPLPQVEV